MNQEAGAGLMGLRYLHPVVLHAGAQARCVLGGGGMGRGASGRADDGAASPGLRVLIPYEPEYP